MRQAILFLVDGLRPDALQVANTPTWDGLRARGASTLSARTVMPSVTLPCIASLMLSAPPVEHGIQTNTWSTNFPGAGIFEAVAESGGSAASFYNWEQLRDLSRPGKLQAGVYLNNSHAPGGAGDLELAELAAGYLREHSVDFAFIYLGHTDAAGHDHGWMSPPYLRAVENADRCIATVLNRLGERADRLIVVTSDHGGHDTHHGTPVDEDMTTPLLLSRHTAAKRRIPDGAMGDVSILDIAPTIAAWMGIEPPRTWQGRPVLDPEILLS